MKKIDVNQIPVLDMSESYEFSLLPGDVVTLSFRCASETCVLITSTPLPDEMKDYLSV